MLLALAGRQSRPPFSSGDLSNYDTNSYIYRWSFSNGRFELKQTLGPEEQSVVEDGAGEIMAQHFCFPHCNSQAVSPVPYLRGATGMKAFTHGGETYLAVRLWLCCVCPGANKSDKAVRMLCLASSNRCCGVTCDGYASDMHVPLQVAPSVLGSCVKE